MKFTRRLTAEALEVRLAFNAAPGVCELQHAFVEPLDANGDHRVTPRDALVVINAIERYGEQVPQGLCSEQGVRVDLNQDGKLTPSDALVVINWLTEQDQDQRALNAARANWSANRLYNYDLLYHTAVQAGVRSVQSIVRYGFPQSPAGAADHFGDDQAWSQAVLTVDGLFDLIQHAIDNQYARIDVTYDPVTGVPKQASFDPIASAADDEFRFDVESLTAPVNDLSGVSAQLEAARQRWSENAPGDYELRYREFSVFVSFERVVDVVGGDSPVGDGAVGRFDPADGFSELYLSVEGMYDLIDYAIDQEFEQIDVAFDATTGHPLYLSLNALRIVPDAEFGIRSVELRVD